MAETSKTIDARYSYKDYETWNDTARWEIIDGVPYNMSPSPSRIHQAIMGIIFNKFFNFLEGKKCKVYAAPLDVRLADEEGNEENTGNVVQPDIVVVCDNSKLDNKGVKGAPDLVVEIISPSSASMDYIKKLELYEKNNVKEYWIVHPIDKIVMVYKIGEDGKYGKPVIYSEENKVEVGILCNELTIDLGDVFKVE